MSYCRSYDRKHEVYMYHDVDGYIACCGCKLGGRRCPGCGDIRISTEKFFDNMKNNFFTRTEAIKHLLKHRKAGHNFPLRAIRTLQAEILAIGDRVSPEGGEDELKKAIEESNLKALKRLIKDYPKQAKAFMSGGKS